MKLRMQITKDKDIRFISHLEYVRTIGRAIRRAKLPAAYSEGFNPHLKFSLASGAGRRRCKLYRVRRNRACRADGGRKGCVGS